MGGSTKMANAVMANNEFSGRLLIALADATGDAFRRTPGNVAEPLDAQTVAETAGLPHIRTNLSRAVTSLEEDGLIKRILGAPDKPLTVIVTEAGILAAQAERPIWNPPAVIQLRPT
jgi:hypothetical protein